MRKIDHFGYADTDIYVTGSNSKLMSSELSTYLTGRYISIPVYTLSFSEYLEFKKSDSHSVKELLNEYLRFGGFPIVALGHFDERSVYQIEVMRSISERKKRRKLTLWRCSATSASMSKYAVVYRRNLIGKSPISLKSRITTPSML